MFQEKGYAAASIEDVAREVGMLKGSLYNYISTKEDLLLAVVAPPAERLLQEVRRLRDAELPASEKVRGLTRVHVRILDEYFPYVSVYVHEVVGHGHPEWAERDREYVSAVVGVLDEGVARGEFAADVPSHTAALTLIGALNWLTRWYRPGGPEGPDQMADEIATLFLRGLLTRTS